MGDVSSDLAAEAEMVQVAWSALNAVDPNHTLLGYYDQKTSELKTEQLADEIWEGGIKRLTTLRLGLLHLCVKYRGLLDQATRDANRKSA